MKTSNVSPDDVRCILNGTLAYVITYEKATIVGMGSGSYHKEGNNESISGNLFLFSKTDLLESFYPELVLEDIFDCDCYLNSNEGDEVDFLGEKEEGGTKILYFNRLTSATLLEGIKVYRERLEELIGNAQKSKYHNRIRGIIKGNKNDKA